MQGYKRFPKPSANDSIDLPRSSSGEYVDFLLAELKESVLQKSNSSLLEEISWQEIRKSNEDVEEDSVTGPTLLNLSTFELQNQASIPALIAEQFEVVDFSSSTYVGNFLLTEVKWDELIDQSSKSSYSSLLEDVSWHELNDEEAKYGLKVQREEIDNAFNTLLNSFKAPQQPIHPDNLEKAPSFSLSSLKVISNASQQVTSNDSLAYPSPIHSICTQTTDGFPLPDLSTPQCADDFIVLDYEDVKLAEKRQKNNESSKR